MNKLPIVQAIGKLAVIMVLIMIIPATIAFFLDTPAQDIYSILHPAAKGFFLTIPPVLLIGSILVFITRKNGDAIGVREGYVIVTFGWIALSIIGCLPLFCYFYLTQGSGNILTIFHLFTDAFFETVSGFTTTGSTILASVETLPRGLLFWRSMTHWLGGMGIITLALALFPAMGVSGYSMFKSEVPGPTKKRLMPRLSETAKVLWGVYLGFTIAQTVLLTAGGMPLFDSLCHTFSTIATGGFSTKNGSIGQYQNPYFHWVITIFMFISGINYVIHYQVLFRKNSQIILKDRELIFYTSTVLIAIIFITGILYWNGLPDKHEPCLYLGHNNLDVSEYQHHIHIEAEKVRTLHGSFSEAAFQVVSVITTTGFYTADFNLWPNICRYLLIVLMFWGGCAGSTSGGVKIIRVMTVLKSSWQELGKLARPRLVHPFKIGDEIIPENRLMNILALFNLLMIIFVGASGIMCFFIDDLVTAVTSVAATLFNVGPGLEAVGAIENFAWIPLPGKWVLTFCMLLGRLEVFSVLIALRPDIWRE